MLITKLFHFVTSINNKSPRFSSAMSRGPVGQLQQFFYLLIRNFFTIHFYRLDTSAVFNDISDYFKTIIHYNSSKNFFANSSRLGSLAPISKIAQLSAQCDLTNLTRSFLSSIKKAWLPTAFKSSIKSAALIFFSVVPPA